MIKEILENKNVILVGPAAYLENSKKRDFIESFDVIVRLNNGFVTHPELIQDIGNRTDILYHCLWGPVFPMSIPLLKNNIKILKSSYPDIAPFNIDIQRFQNINLDRIEFEIYELEKFNFLKNTLKSRPNTGTSAIYDLMSYNIKNLHISGITMFAGGYQKKYRQNFIFNNREEVEKSNLSHKVHNIKNQIEFLRDFLQNDIITMDQEVKESIYE